MDGDSTWISDRSWTDCIKTAGGGWLPKHRAQLALYPFGISVYLPLQNFFFFRLLSRPATVCYFTPSRSLVLF